jgi:hypothetical protein
MITRCCVLVLALCPLTLAAEQSISKAQREADEALAKGEALSAIVALEHVPEAKRTERETLTLAEGYLRYGDSAKAIVLAEPIAAESSAPGADAWLLIARARLLRGEHEAMKSAAAEAVKAEPTRAGAYLILGQALQLNGEAREAEAAFATFRLLNWRKR